MINPRYFELRTTPTHDHTNLAADMMRHLHARQYLGKAVIICQHPAVLLPDASKQWLKLSRNIQQRRLQTSDADKILKYTHTITHMQHVRFTDKTPLEDPEADVHFLRDDQLGSMPARCYSLYTNKQLDSAMAAHILRQLPTDALVIDYTQCLVWNDLDCKPKQELNAQVAASWGSVQQFLSEQRLTIESLFDGQLQNIEAMDDALDTLLAHSHRFLQVADTFRHMLELARPLHLGSHLRSQYDALILLAHRVQALSGSSFTQRFLETYNEDNTFFLYDAGRKRYRMGQPNTEDLAAIIAAHQCAGRKHLAAALSQIAQAKPAHLPAFVTI